MNSIILILASRQEYIWLYLKLLFEKQKKIRKTIFHLQILEAQVNSMSSNDRMYLMQKIQYKILKVEQRRIQIESQTLLNYSEPRKFLQKLVKKYIKIQGYYYQKLQLYFPIFSQRKQFLPMQRNQLFKIASNSTMSSTEIIQIIINLQKERLVRQIDSLVKSINRNEALQTDLITNRNEKFCQDPIQSLEYLNHIHLTYYLQNKPTYKNDPYDIMNLDEQTKEFLMSGFKSYVCCLTKTKNVFIDIQYDITIFQQKALKKLLYLDMKSIGKSLMIKIMLQIKGQPNSILKITNKFKPLLRNKQYAQYIVYPQNSIKSKTKEIFFIKQDQANKKMKAEILEHFKMGSRQTKNPMWGILLEWNPKGISFLIQRTLYCQSFNLFQIYWFLY